MTIQQSYPNSRPSLNLNFALSKKLDPVVTFSRTTSGTQINRSGAIESVPYDTARFDHDPATLEPRGLLIEKSSVNQFRNNIMQGAAIGSPGTAPTYWSFGTSSGGITRSIVGVGQEDGINYIDVRWIGTASGSPYTYWSFAAEQVNHIPATASSIFTFSTYIKQIAGSFPGTSNFIKVFRVGDSGNTNLGQYKVYTVPLSSTVNKRLIENRHSFTNTTFTGSVAYMVPYYQWNFATGDTVDVTLRIGLPQVEPGSLMTSVILSTGTQDGIRGTDNVTIEGDNFSKWFNQREGTIFADMGPYVSADTANFGISIGSANDNYLAFPYITSGGAYGRNLFWRDPTTAETIDFPDGSTAGKYAIAYKNSERLTGYFDGTLSEDTVGPWPNPSGYNSLRIGTSHFASGERQNFYLKQFTYYPSALSNAILQTLTK